MSPFTSGSPRRSAERPEEVREGAEAGKREREVDAAVGGNWEVRADLPVVVVLELDAEAATLRVIRRRSHLADHRVSANVPVEVVGAAHTVVEERQVRVAAEERVAVRELVHPAAAEISADRMG